jgi:eukaryotic-like serine/threonine-protein kinase
MEERTLDGRYRIERLIGDGGMARVYLGRDLRLGRPVAVKIPHAHIAADPEFRARFQHEALAAASLHHPNIVDVFDVGQQDGSDYIVMEFVEGLDLKRVIQRDAPLNNVTAVQIAIQIAVGLHAAHQAGMVHRDVKPQNVIVTADGHARVTDFGIAKSKLSTALTETGISLGTVDYLSPEQAAGRSATAQSDLYALGVVLFEMLSGKLPFSGENPVAVAVKHLQEPPPSLRRLNPAVPPGLEAIVLRALSKDPARRQQDLAEFADQLRQFLLASRQPTVAAELVVPPAPPEPRPARPSPEPPRSSGPRDARRPQTAQQGIGCGIFAVGLLILGAVISLVLLLGSGVLTDLFDPGSAPRPTAANGTAAPGPTVGTTATATPQLIEVPQLVNLSDGDAQQLLRDAGLLPAPRGEHSSAVPQGIVIAQQDLPPARLAAGSTVSYTVSLGPVLISVPNVVGTRRSLAESQVTMAGLRVVVELEASSSVDEGFVLRQQPSGDLRIAEGESVTLVVSRGDVVQLPAVIGASRETARSLLDSTAGLTLVFIDEQGPDRLPDYANYPPDTVVSAARESASGLTGLSNGDWIPRNSRIVLGVRAP